MTRPDSPDLLADLNSAQEEAVTHVEGPLLVVAGPGSGKTRVITRRVAYLIQQNIPPSSILAITFTNKAAGEMRQRVDALVPGNRVWISTFHSFGARLLRQYGDRLELDRNFTIYDQTDRAKMVRFALEDVGMDNGRFKPETISNAISKAKNELLSPDRYARQTEGYFEEVVAKVYPAYEKRLRDANALDFDDLLYWPAMALKNDAELRAELDARFRYLLIDEYQDTNQAQYAIARGLSIDHMNICVVGDIDQCLPPETIVETWAGPRRIDELQEGELVLTGSGWGKTIAMPIEKVMVNPYQGPMIKITFAGGRTVRGTPNHIGFGKLRPDCELHYTYLMWKRGMGYRIGTTRGMRVSKRGDIQSGLQVRTNQEFADAMWILRAGTSAAEAYFYEHYYSVRYGIPTMVFYVRGRRMAMTQEWIDRIYSEIDSEGAALRLMTDLHLDPRYPHHRPGAVNRQGTSRRHVNFTVFGGPRAAGQPPWHEHRVQLITSDQRFRQEAEARFRARSGARGTWRIETSRKQYDQGLTLAQDILSLDPEMELVSRAKLTSQKPFPFLPFSHLHPGMVVPVHENGFIVERTIEKVEWEQYEGPVYDLSIPATRNFIADGMVVHNSVYGWRGSDIRNILHFERDFPNARVLTLSLNYRSTKPILDAAGALIAHNRDRRPKDLITDRTGGAPVRVLTFETGNEEADGIVRQIKEAVESGRRKHYRDFAVFLRVNALTRTLEQAFVRHQVPFQIVRGLAFFDRKENRDILAYLRLIVNPRDNLSFQRIINEPTRGIGKVSLAHLRRYAEPRELSLMDAAHQFEQINEIKGKAARGLRDFSIMMRELQEIVDAQPDELIRQVLDKSGYRTMLRDSRDEEDQARLENIEELITAAKQFADGDSTRTIGDFLENITLASDVDGWDEAMDSVSVMTLHAAKGLEFPVVYMMAVEQGILPHERSLTKRDQLEEERRLTFVGMTRAEEELNLCHARLREFRGQTLYAIPSGFLDELPEEVERQDLSSSTARRAKVADQWRSGSPSAEAGWADAGALLNSSSDSTSSSIPYQRGMLVSHEKYGQGRVLEVGGQGVLRKVKIRFQTAGTRTFLVDKVKLEILDTE